MGPAHGRIRAGSRNPLPGWRVGSGVRRSVILFAAAACGTAALLALAAPARANEDMQLYLTWHAPYGAPGATTDLSGAWGDSTREDTLYMSFDLGTDAESFNGFMATLLLHPAIGDTLEQHWRFGHGMDNLKGVRPLWSIDSIPGARVPWRGLRHLAAIHYDYTSGLGTLKMTFAIPAGASRSFKYGERFCIGRLLFQRPSAGDLGARHPICIEWATSTLSLWFGYYPEVTSGERFVTWNAPDGRACEPFRAPVKVRPWKPPGAATGR